MNVICRVLGSCLHLWSLCLQASGWGVGGKEGQLSVLLGTANVPSTKLGALGWSGHHLKHQTTLWGIIHLFMLSFNKLLFWVYFVLPSHCVKWRVYVSEANPVAPSLYHDDCFTDEDVGSLRRSAMLVASGGNSKKDLTPENRALSSTATSASQPLDHNNECLPPPQTLPRHFFFHWIAPPPSMK